MSSSEKIKVYIVDDHQMLIDGIKALLKNEKNISVIGEAIRSVDAVQQIQELKPDMLLSDISMPEMNGIELTKIVKKNVPEIKVLVLSMFNEKSLINEMIDAGASGYILKNTGKKELLEAINKIMNGGLYFSDDVADEMSKTTFFVEKNTNVNIHITHREMEIIQLIALEYNNSKIAEKLFISERTVETHRKNIFRKTGTHTVLSLVNFARENNLI